MIVRPPVPAELETKPFTLSVFAAEIINFFPELIFKLLFRIRFVFSYTPVPLSIVNVWALASRKIPSLIFCKAVPAKIMVGVLL